MHCNHMAQNLLQQLVIYTGSHMATINKQLHGRLTIAVTIEIATCLVLSLLDSDYVLVTMLVVLYLFNTLCCEYIIVSVLVHTVSEVEPLKY